MQRKKLLLLLALLMTAATGAWAQTQTWDSGDCTVTLSDDVMTVSGAGAMADYEDTNLTPWYSYRSDVKTIVIESGVTSIGNFDFSRFEKLESVSIPASVTSIGKSAFGECGTEATTALTVSFAEGSAPLTIGEEAFRYANLKSIDIPNRVTSIGNCAFTCCRNLESVSIPASVTSIGERAFEDGGQNATALTVSFAEGSTPLTISDGAFGAAKLTSIDIPNRVTSIGNCAFSDCSNLESVSIPASVTSIGEVAFIYCGMLANVYIYAPSLTTYGIMAFDNNAAGRKIYVLSDAVDTYKAGWSAYAADIEAMTLYATSVKDGTEDAAKWTITPNPAATGQTVTIQYNGRLKVKGVKATSDAAPAAPTYNETKSINDGPVTVAAGEHWLITGTGTQTTNTISIAAGATVTLDGATISSGDYCIKCLGDATIILKDGSTNTLTGTGDSFPALSIGDANTTLTIQGSTGVLNVTSGPYCAGIGGGYMNTNSTCGNIRIEGGVITAQGGENGAGIGSDYGANCGDIIITGGTITAKGGNYAAGIGTGEGSDYPVVCGDITIANTVTKVTATKGEDATHSIGEGDNGACGTVTIGGTVYWQNNAAVGDGATYLAQATIEYPAAAKPAATVTTAPTGAAIVGVGKSTALVSGGAADGGTLMYAVTTTNTKPTSTAGFSASVPTAETIKASGKVYVWYFVKADDTHSDSEIAAAAIEVPVADIVWDATNITDLMLYGTGQYEKEGITLSVNAEEMAAAWYNYGYPTLDGIAFNAKEPGGFTFTAPTGKAFTKIEMKPLRPGGWNTAYVEETLGSDWTFVGDFDNNNYTVTWNGSAASTVGLLTGAEEFGGETISYIAFYLSE